MAISSLRQNRFLLEQDNPGGRNLVRQALTQRKIPEAAMDIVMASLTNSSYKQYETSWKKWWSYCRTENINPLSSSVENEMLFLTQLYETGSSHSTLNCHRSAVSLLLGPEMAQDDRMRRFFRGLTKLRPSKPKYDYTWDPKIVLKYFSDSANNDTLSMKELSLKLISLLALITAHIMQTFASKKLENIAERKDCIEIKIPDPIKTSGTNTAQPLLIIPVLKKIKRFALLLHKKNI
ncbi:hypothetical protein TKK_0010262 [Trichogramma kaykai]|uniref:Uncharacterized protein n=1 Tax=Trichogramma kaykai TaxID=54128 RepID=A0ABD2WZQ1_9HYME